MRNDVMLTLAHEAARTITAQAEIEALSDEELTAKGYEEDEIAAIRDGYLSRMLRLGVTFEDVVPLGCCGGL